MISIEKKGKSFRNAMIEVLLIYMLIDLHSSYLLVFNVTNRCKLGQEGITHCWSMVQQFTLVVPVCVVFLVMVLKQHNV